MERRFAVWERRWWASVSWKKEVIKHAPKRKSASSHRIEWTFSCACIFYLRPSWMQNMHWSEKEEPYLQSSECVRSLGLRDAFLCESESMAGPCTRSRSFSVNVSLIASSLLAVLFIFEHVQMIMAKLHSWWMIASMHGRCFLPSHSLCPAHQFYLASQIRME